MEKKIAKEIALKLKLFKPRNIEVKHGLIFCEIDSKDIVKVIKTLHNDKQLSFKILTDITAIDYPERDMRFELVYNLLSLANNCCTQAWSHVSSKSCADQDQDTAKIKRRRIFSVCPYARKVYRYHHHSCK